MANNNVDTATAISSLRPDSQWMVEQDLSGNDVVTWISGGVEPTAAEITAERTRLQAIYDGNAYQRTRADAYEEVKEQLDQLYHDMAADKGDKTGTWFAAIKAVKDATPKP